jgi:hypothetical protein
LIKTEVPDAPAVELRGGLIGVKLTDPDFIVTQVMSQILGDAPEASFRQAMRRAR